MIPATGWSAEPVAAPTAELEPAALIRSLAQPAPATTAFKEVRFSPLLDRPLIVGGELRYEGPASLDRIVMEPYREHTAIRGESVRIERDGERPRTFALKRAPELQGLLNAFAGLLAGDPAAVERSFATSVSGSAEAWELRLAPHDARARQRLRELTMMGAQETPRCMTMLTADGAHSVMLLGEAAARTVAPTVSAAELQTYCASPAQ